MSPRSRGLSGSFGLCDEFADRAELLIRHALRGRMRGEDEESPGTDHFEMRVWTCSEWAVGDCFPVASIGLAVEHDSARPLGGNPAAEAGDPRLLERRSVLLAGRDLGDAAVGVGPLSRSRRREREELDESCLSGAATEFVPLEVAYGFQVDVATLCAKRDTNQFAPRALHRRMLTEPVGPA